MVSQAELILRVITLWFLVLSQFFRHGMGPFNKFWFCNLAGDAAIIINLTYFDQVKNIICPTTLITNNLYGNNLFTQVSYICFY